jgi:hypothetical protein
MNLVIDHEHFVTDVFRSPEAAQKWTAIVRFKDGRTFTQLGPTKKAAIAAVKDQALPESVRGLLCPGRHGKAGHGTCNRLLGHVDNIPWLKAAIRYLEHPPAAMIREMARVANA